MTELSGKSLSVKPKKRRRRRRKATKTHNRPLFSREYPGARARAMRAKIAKGDTVSAAAWWRHQHMPATRGPMKWWERPAILGGLAIAALCVALGVLLVVVFR